jgi:hypothetical protein
MTVNTILNLTYSVDLHRYREVFNRFSYAHFAYEKSIYIRIIDAV